MAHSNDDLEKAPLLVKWSRSPNNVVTIKADAASSRRPSLKQPYDHDASQPSAKTSTGQRVRSCMKQLSGSAHGCIRLFWDSGLACASTAALCASLSSLCVKLTAGRVPLFEVAAYRSTLALAASATVILLQGVKPRYLLGQRANMPLLLMRGTSGALAILAKYLALFNLPIADAVVITNIGPPLTALLAWLLLKERLGWLGIGGCLLSLAGVVVVANPPFMHPGTEGPWNYHRAMGVLGGLGNAFSAAGSAIIIRLIATREQPLVIALWFHMVTMAVSWTPLLAHWPHGPTWPRGTDHLLLLGVTATTFLAQLFQTRGFQLLSASVGSSVGFTQVAYSYMWGTLLFHDQVTLMGCLGSLMITTGVLATSLRKKHKSGPGGGNNNTHGSSTNRRGSGGSSGSSSKDLEASLLLDEDHHAEDALGPSDPEAPTPRRTTLAQDIPSLTKFSDGIPIAAVAAAPHYYASPPTLTTPSSASSPGGPSVPNYPTYPTSSPRIAHEAVPELPARAVLAAPAPALRPGAAATAEADINASSPSSSGSSAEGLEPEITFRCDNVAMADRPGVIGMLARQSQQHTCRQQ